jgi:cysteine desulfurase
MPSRRVYLDWAATSPLGAAARAAMEPFFGDHFGNASSIHAFGKRARMAIDTARQQVAAALGCAEAEVVFTSGGTEADNLALLGAWRARRDNSRRHVLVSAIEHEAILRAAEWLEREGAEVDWVPPTADGIVTADRVRERWRPETCLVALMAVNNEVGTLQPVSEVARLAHQNDALVVCDAVQALGDVPIDVRGWDVDFLSISAHKISGPQGAGALFCRAGVPLAPVLFGGGQENQRRAGTENVAAICGMGAAVAALQLSERRRALSERFRRLVDGVLAGVPQSRLVGHENERCMHLACFEFCGVDAETLLFALDLEGIAASSGSACSSHTVEPSHVLGAMGMDRKRATSCVRFSWGPQTPLDDIDYLLERLPSLVARNERVKVVS